MPSFSWVYRHSPGAVCSTQDKVTLAKLNGEITRRIVNPVTLPDAGMPAEYLGH